MRGCQRRPVSGSLNDRSGGLRLSAVIVLLVPTWSPPGVDPSPWRAALAEDVVDLLAPLPQVETAIAALAADLPLAAKIAWPSMPLYELPRCRSAPPSQAAAADGHERAVVLMADAPDLPAMLIGKMIRPLSTRTVAVAPAAGGGLLGVASRLPVPVLAARPRPGDRRRA